MLVGILASFAAFEADLISARTKAALAVVRKNGSKSGKAIGNPNFRPVTPAVAGLISELRSQGLSYAKIADTLNERGVPTARGGKRWHSRTVLNIANRALQAA
jgi:DNA invertase Pin-like site-specific DNA recombinase